MNTITETAAEIARSYFEAIDRSDTEAIVGLFAPDGHLMADEYPTASGSAAIRATFEGAFAAMKMSSAFTIDRVSEVNDLAIVEAHSTDTVTMLAANTAVDLDFRELFVLRRSGSSWLITDYIFNRRAQARMA